MLLCIFSLSWTQTGTSEPWFWLLLKVVYNYYPGSYLLFWPSHLAPINTVAWIHLSHICDIQWVNLASACLWKALPRWVSKATTHCTQLVLSSPLGTLRISFFCVPGHMMVPTSKGEMAEERRGKGEYENYVGDGIIRICDWLDVDVRGRCQRWWIRWVWR